MQFAAKQDKKKITLSYWKPAASMSGKSGNYQLAIKR